MQNLRRDRKIKIRALLISTAVFILAPFAVFASGVNGTVSGSAWSPQIGWINFGAFSGANAVQMTDANLSGYAWNENKGRINLNPTRGGVKNDGNGLLSGYAWCEGSGWINFAGVSVNSSGVFSGIATGDNNLSINFSCDRCNVKTDWSPQTAGNQNNGSGGGGGNGGILPADASKKPVLPLSVLINNGANYINSQTVTLNLKAGSDVAKMSISNSSNFAGSIQEEYKSEKSWTLGAGDGTKTVYVKFYTKYGQASDVVEASIVLDTLAPVITVTNIKTQYSSDEDIIVGGKTENDAEITTLLDDSKYAMFQANNDGNWLVSFGKMLEGKHHLDFTVKDLAGNLGNDIAVDFLVGKAKPAGPVAVGPLLGQALSPIFRQLENTISPLIPEAFKQKKLQPVVIVTVPKTTPLAFKGSLYPLAFNSLTKFVLSPLPTDIKMLAEQVPQINKTFAAVGVQKITDVNKLANANLKIPTLTEITSVFEPNIVATKFSAPQGIPIAKLSAIAKSKIPSGIVFTKAAGGLVDFNIALSVSDQGQLKQTIKTVANSPLQLVVREDKPVKNIIGYIVFDSRKPSPVASNVSLNYLAASLTFAPPDTATVQQKPITEEQQLILAQFNYQYTGNGVYTATINSPVSQGEYQIITVVNYQDTAVQSKEIKMITVVDPEGYVFEKAGDRETRILGAVVSLYWLNPKTEKYEIWPANDYQQENPQTTDVSGTYSFLVPEGYYYLKVEAPGYFSYNGKSFEVKEGSGIHTNIELKNQYWWLNIIDWKTILLILVVLMLFYNFYQDRVRQRLVRIGEKK